MCCRKGKDGCSGRRGRVPGRLSVLQDAHFGPLSSYSRTKASVFCFGINWTGCAKIGGRLPQLRGSTLFIGRSTVVTELSLPNLLFLLHNSISFPWSLPYSIPQLSLEGLLCGRTHRWGSVLLLPGWLWRNSLVLQMRK